jgi:hypothetical protein
VHSTQCFDWTKQQTVWKNNELPETMPPKASVQGLKIGKTASKEVCDKQDDVYFI